MGLSSSRAFSRASSPHGYQSTGLSLCWSRYGEVSFASRLAIAWYLPTRERAQRVRELRAEAGARRGGDRRGVRERGHELVEAVRREEDAALVPGEQEREVELP